MNFILKEGDELFPTGPDGKLIFDDVDYLETWKGMEEVYKKGLTKSIGVSNFNKNQLQRVLDNAEIIPVTNQVCSFLKQREHYCSISKPAF